MAITGKIEKKIEEKSVENSKVRDFLIAILEKEEAGGHYKKKYEELLENIQLEDKK